MTSNRPVVLVLVFVLDVPVFEDEDQNEDEDEKSGAELAAGILRRGEGWTPNCGDGKDGDMGIKRPLVVVALLFAGGILLGEQIAVPIIYLFTALTVLTGAALFAPGTRPGILWPLLVVAGWTNIALHTQIISPDDLRVLMQSEAAQATVRGAIVERPVERVFMVDEDESWRTLAQVDVSEIHLEGTWRPAHGRIVARTPGTLEFDLARNQQVEIRGVLRQPREPLAPGLFDYRSALQRRGIHFQLDTTPANWARLEPVVAHGLDERFFNWAKATLQRGLPEEDDAVRLRWAMTLGLRTGLTGEVAEPFMRSGTMHVFAISGLHVALIAGILLALLRVLRVPRRICGWMVIGALWFYTVVTGYQSSAIRATIMLTVLLSGWSLQRPIDLLNSLFAAAFLILAWQPQQIFQASFQLSFCVVVSIALLLPHFEKLRQRIFAPDPFLPPELRPRWQQRLDWPVRFVSVTFVTSLAAWLGSLPLVAYHFHLFTPVGLLANVAVVPLGMLALMSNFGSLLCGAWFPFGTELFNHAGWLWMSGMIGVSQWCAAWPGAWFYVPAPSLLTFAAYYSLLVAALTFKAASVNARQWLAALLALLTGAWLWSGAAERQNTKMTVLPLSGGEAVFIDAPGTANDLLIDCGNRQAADSVLTPFLRAHGVNRLNTLLLTHGDLQHIGGTDTVLSRFHTGTIVTSPARFRSTAYRDLLARLRDDSRWHTVAAGDRLGVWDILHPHADDQCSQADDCVLVLRGDIGGVSVLLLSDLGRSGQHRLLERHPDLRADVVVAGLPTQGEPLNPVLLSALEPKLIIIADADYPATARASAALRERLSACGIPVVYCREAGAVTLSFKPGRLEAISRAGPILLLRAE